MTWGRENGDASRCTSSPWVCTYEGMDDVIRTSYQFMAEENQAELAPAGAVWRYLRTNYPTINLYSSDGSHPSLQGSYAAACAFYTMIYKKDPTLITWNSSLSESEATTIKMAAKTIVYDAISVWDYTVNPAVADYTEVIQAGEVSFAVTTENFDSLVWDFGDGTNSTETNPIHTYAASGSYTVTLTVIKCGKSNSQSKTIEIDTTLNTAIFTLENNFTIYPNPTSNLLNITLNRNFKNIKVVLCDTKGFAVSTKEVQDLSDLSIDISTFSSGTYLLKITADQNIFTSKILKK
jgi:PKD repeat protein